MSVRFLDLGRQYLALKQEIDAAISEVIQKAAFISGPYVENFERQFSEYLGVPHCIACANGTDAIEIAIEALRLPQKSEIIVPANTFIASAEAVTRCGHKVVFCDCDPSSYTISIESVQRKLTARTAAVIAVHLYGRSCDMSALRNIGDSANLKIIEDCAQAHGAAWRGRKVGTIGDIATFSFYPGKNLGAYGDAGAITTSDEDLARRVRMIANHGRIDKYNHEFEGRNSRMDGIQGAILSVKLRHLDAWIVRRREIAAAYQSGLSGTGDLVLPDQGQVNQHVFHLFVVRTKQRDALRKFLRSRDIETGVHYPISLPKLAAYAYCNQAAEPMLANEIASELLSLPIGDQMSLDESKEVIDACGEYFRNVERQG